jgi:rod shape-determining protein MreD
MFSTRYLRACLVCIFILLDITLFKGVTIFGARPDLVFILAMFYGLNRGFLHGAGIGFAGGLIKDIFLNPYIGPEAFSLTLTGFLAGLFGRRVFYQNIVIQILIIFTATLFKMLLTNGLLRLIGHPPNPVNGIVSQAFFNAFLTPPLFLFLGKIIQMENRNPL